MRQVPVIVRCSFHCSYGFFSSILGVAYLVPYNYDTCFLIRHNYNTCFLIRYATSAVNHLSSSGRRTRRNGIIGTLSGHLTVSFITVTVTMTMRWVEPHYIMCINYLWQGKELATPTPVKEEAQIST